MPESAPTAVLAALAVSVIAAGPAQAKGHHGKAHHHRAVHHRAASSRTVQGTGTGARVVDAGSATGAVTQSIYRAPIPGGRPLPVNVGGTVVAQQSSGTWEQGDDDDGCQVDVDNANSWQQYGDELTGNGDKAGAQKAYDNASTIAGEANAEGCTVFLMED